MPVTLAGVVAAAESLLLAKRKPTLRTVREALGGGSFGTIAPLLRQWDQERRARAQAKEQMPAAVHQVQLQAAASLWQAAQAAAQALQQDTTSALQAQVASQVEQQEETLAVIQGLERDLARAQQAGDALAGELARAQMQLEGRTQELALLRTQVKEQAVREEEARARSVMSQQREELGGQRLMQLEAANGRLLSQVEQLTTALAERLQAMARRVDPGASGPGPA